MLLRFSIGAIAATLPLVYSQFNNPSGVDIWCGKAYRSTNASFNPGGWFEEPAKSNTPLLDLKIKPRMNLYLEDETAASFIVDASISWFVGQPLGFHNTSTVLKNESEISVIITATGNISIALIQTSVKLGSTGNELAFNSSPFLAGFDPYNVTIVGTLLSDKNTTFTASTQFYKLPFRTDNGTVTRIDNLYGGISVHKGQASNWMPIFPYTYYDQWSLYWYANLSTLDEFSAQGYNVIHIVPTGDLGETPFPWDEFKPYLDRAAELGLYLQYDVRWDPTNLTTMIDQVTRLHSHPSILLWYTGDEPDGKSNPINSTAIAYDTIRSIDPYHPVSLALNCYDFYYSSYASGAEIILSDVYPISTNTSWSTIYDTPCNATYGCCGCDDCTGSFTDISDRLDVFARRDSLLGWQKTHWGAPQAFGNDTFWTRYPTAAEEVVMNMLSVNHAAKGIVMWDFPTTESILNVTNKLANVLTNDTIIAYLTGTPLYKGLTASGAESVDASAWIGDNGVLLSIINLNYGDIKRNVTVSLPEGVTISSVAESFWGDAKWTVEGNKMLTTDLMGLEVSLLLLK